MRERERDSESSGKGQGWKRVWWVGDGAHEATASVTGSSWASSFGLDLRILIFVHTGIRHSAHRLERNPEKKKVNFN